MKHLPAAGRTFDTLAAGRRIVTYDPRGRGRSDSVSPDRVSLSTQLLDLETVRRAIGAEQVALIGWSGGGMETFVYALRHPGRVSRLVQLAPVAPRFEPYGALMMEDRARWRDSLAAVAIPRLVIHEARDTTPLAGNEEWVAGHPEARLLVIEGAGHWPHYEQRGRTLAAIATFLAGGWPADARAIGSGR